MNKQCNLSIGWLGLDRSGLPNDQRKRFASMYGRKPIYILSLK